MATTNNFWTNAPANDPKRAYRFRVQFAGTGADYRWYAKKATKPTFTMTESSHQYLNHTYYWPAKTEWNEVDITFVDPVDPDFATELVDLLEAAGYQIPAGIDQTAGHFNTPSKKSFVENTGAIIVEQINEEGEILEQWQLNNAWVKEVTFGDLDYGSEDLTEITVKFRYDWASFGGVGSSGADKFKR